MPAMILSDTELRALLAGLGILEREYRTARLPIPVEVRTTRHALERHTATTLAGDFPTPHTDLMPRTHLTTNEVARTIGVSPRTVQRMITDGRLPSVQIGRARRIPRDALDDLTDTSIPSEPKGTL